MKIVDPGATSKIGFRGTGWNPLDSPGGKVGAGHGGRRVGGRTAKSPRAGDGPVGPSLALFYLLPVPRIGPPFPSLGGGTEGWGFLSGSLAWFPYGNQ